jgi:hypothetical protein
MLKGDRRNRGCRTREHFRLHSGIVYKLKVNESSRISYKEVCRQIMSKVAEVLIVKRFSPVPDILKALVERCRHLGLNVFRS